jgi:MerR family gold-responsive transcriptional activator of gol and ges genes
MRRSLVFSLDLPTAGRFILGPMNIGEAAKISGVNAKLIRHYESIGIIPKASRTDSGYRVYSDSDVHTLTFVKGARRLGFSMKEIKKLVGLWRNRSRASADVKALALVHVKDLEQKVEELQSMIKTLRHLARNCHGDHRPDCPIIEGLAQ